MKALLMSSSKCGDMGYLEHAEPQFRKLFGSDAKDILFIPYAAVNFSFDQYEDTVQTALGKFGYRIYSIHKMADPISAVLNAQAIAIGGGNSFALLHRLYANKLVDIISHRVKVDKIPYIGWSAGSNVATPSIRTTNDMPIIAPPSLRALNLVPFQINPHFISGKPAGHNGETREERLFEFLALNSKEEVLALYEGSALYRTGDKLEILGDKAGILFKQGGEIVKLSAGVEFDINEIQGAEYV